MSRAGKSLQVHLPSTPLGCQVVDFSQSQKLLPAGHGEGKVNQCSFGREGERFRWSFVSPSRSAASCLIGHSRNFRPVGLSAL